MLGLERRKKNQLLLLRRAPVRATPTAPAGQARRAGTKGVRGGGRARGRATGVGGHSKILKCLFSLVFCSSPFFLCLRASLGSRLPLPPPRSGVWLRALAPPTHRAGATRRGRCDATGREARKEDLDAERLCMIPKFSKREEVEEFFRFLFCERTTTTSNFLSLFSTGETTHIHLSLSFACVLLFSRLLQSRPNLLSPSRERA